MKLGSKTERNALLSRVYEATGCRTQAELGVLYGVSQGHIWNWFFDYAKFPGNRCQQTERLTNGKVTAHELRPDLYPDPPAQPVEQEAAA